MITQVSRGEGVSSAHTTTWPETILKLPPRSSCPAKNIHQTSVVYIALTQNYTRKIEFTRSLSWNLEQRSGIEVVILFLIDLVFCDGSKSDGRKEIVLKDSG